MKASYSLLFLFLGMVLMSATDVKTSDPVPYVIYSDDKGNETATVIHDMYAMDWPKPFLRLEFRRGDEVLDLSGVFVNVPKEGEVSAIWFTNNNTLTELMRKALVEQGGIVSGSRVIIDNLTLNSDKKVKFKPVVYTAR